MRTSMRFVVMTLLLLLLGGCATTTQPGVVGVSRSQLLIAPASDIEASAASSYSQMNEKAKSAGKLITSGVQYDRLNQIMNRLARQVPYFRSDRPWRWQLALLDVPQVNAACLPGGKMIFYTGLLDKLQLTNDEIAAVMGHEMAHALREHGRERVSQAMAQGLLVNVATNNAGSAQLANQVIYYTLALPNSREAESEADLIGLELMARAGYNPEAAITLQEKMGKKVGGEPPEFLSSHPGWSTRVVELKAMMPRVIPLYRAAAKPS